MKPAEEKLVLTAAANMLSVYFDLMAGYLTDGNILTENADAELLQTDFMQSLRYFRPEGLPIQRTPIPEEYNYHVPAGDFRVFTAEIFAPRWAIRGNDKHSVWEMAMVMADMAIYNFNVARWKHLPQPDEPYAHVFYSTRVPRFRLFDGDPFRFDRYGDLHAQAYTIEAIIFPRKANP